MNVDEVFLIQRSHFACVMLLIDSVLENYLSLYLLNRMATKWQVTVGCQGQLHNQRN